MSTLLHSRVQLGDMEACTWLDAETGAAGLTLIPFGMSPLPFESKKQRVDSMVQLKRAGSPYPGAFSGGVTLRNSPDTAALHLVDQQVGMPAPGQAELRTTLEDGHGGRVLHRLRWTGGPFLLCDTEFENTSAETAELELLSSFSLCGLSPFVPGDAHGRLRVHRARGVWSMEGRLQTDTLEQLQLEPSWAGHGVRCERFGQVGSMPCNHWFPWVMVEDTESRVFWGAQIAHNASWQMELYRKDDGLAVSGGLADRDFGHWKKAVPAGGRFAAPTAILTVCRAACLDDAAERLVRAGTAAADAGPGSEQQLPVMFNEYCTTWGNPSQARLRPLLQALRGRGFAYFVIDAGWYRGKDADWSSSMGDYVPSAELFPQGLAAMGAEIRAAGMVPGLWFELENVAPRSRAWQDEARLLRRDGRPLETTARRFRAMADPEVRAGLHRICTELLKEAGFGYIKIDYNDSVGPGCDGYESEGEGLRQTMAGSVQFLRELKAALPGLVVENCASGGHRLEPLMLQLSAMSSFSDAHECEEIPIIAANLHRLMLPRQCQIWAVLHPSDTDVRLVYSLTNTFLGRMCVSGDVEKLSEHQWALVEEAISFYREIVPCIRDGQSRRYGPEVSSYRHPEGWQAVLRLIPEREAVLILHVFNAPPEAIEFDLPFGDYTPGRVYTACAGALTLQGAHLRYVPACPMSTLAVRLTRTPRGDDDE